MNVLIIEDETKTARELKRSVEMLRKNYVVIEILPSVKAAIKWFSEHEMPDLILSDIQLADGLSFEIYQSVDILAPVIFCTAFDQYAIKAFEANGIDYLLKPVDEEKLSQSLKKYEQMKKIFAGEEKGYDRKLEALFEQMKVNYKSTLLVYYREKIIPVKTDEISFIHSAAGIVSIYTDKNQQFLIDQTLEELENQLNPRRFFKANRQFIINRDAIRDVEHFFTRRLVVKLLYQAPETIIISKVKAGEFLRWIEG